MSRDSLPKVGLPFDWRWFFYAPLLAVAVGIFVFGSCSKNDQFVTFDGRMLQSGEQSQGTLLEFDGDDLESGSLSTMADELFPRVSEGAPLLIVLNGEAAKCPELIPLETDGQDRFGNEESLTVRCEKGSASLVTVKNVSLELGFQEPTNMRAQARSASSISVEATGRFDIFPASLEVIYSFDPAQIPEARRTDCGGLLQVPVLDITGMKGAGETILARDYFASAEHITTVFSFDTRANEWKVVSISPNSTATVEVGRAYWVFSATASNLVLAP